MKEVILLDWDKRTNKYDKGHFKKLDPGLCWTSPISMTLCFHKSNAIRVIKNHKTPILAAQERAGIGSTTTMSFDYQQIPINPGPFYIMSFLYWP